MKKITIKFIPFFLFVSCISITLQSCKDDEGDPCVEETWYQDLDGDGFGNNEVTESACEMPAGFAAVGGDVDDSDADLNPNTVWSGPEMTFTKGENEDPTEEASQDRITENVWITRGSGGALYNIKSETQYEDFLSPVGTLWAVGTTASIGSLNFTDFETASGDGPPTLVDKDMVLFLVQENVYLDIKLTSWERGGGNGNAGTGGFSYIRSTPTP